jgi:hypothetical protein
MLTIPSTTAVNQENAKSAIDTLRLRAQSVGAEIVTYGFGVWISDVHGAIVENVAIARASGVSAVELCRVWEQECVLNDNTLVFADGSTSVSTGVVQKIVKRNWKAVATKLAEKYGGATAVPAPSGTGWIVWALVF